MRSLLTVVLALCAIATAGARPAVSFTVPAFQSGRAPAGGNDASGMYTFLREGEFVQLTLDEGRLSGYISRFGDSDSDKGQIVDQFFDKASLQGDRLTFNTKVIHGVWFEFNGTMSTAPGKKPGEEGYRIIKGTLVEHVTDANGAEKAMQRQVDFKSFPADLSQP